MLRRCFTALLIFCLLLAFLPAALAEEVQPWSRERPEYLVDAHLFSQSALLMDGDTGEVLYAKNAEIRQYPASTTKVMTLLLAVESGIPLNETITIPAAAADVPEGSSVVPVTPGEQMSFADLLYGFMMRSGNDGANAIAVLVSGSIDAFVARMNARAAELGCANTHFVNAHGYHDENHYSTALDLARIARAAMENEAFRKIVATAKYTMSATSRRDALEIITRNELVNPDSKYYYPDAVGIKTGFHTPAGQCLVGAARRNGKLLISVTLNSDGQDETLKWYDTARLFEYGYTRYELCGFNALCEAAPADLLTIPVAKAAADDPAGGQLALRLSSPDTAAMMVLTGEGRRAEAIRRLLANAEVSLPGDVAAPVAEGQQLGSFACTLPDGTRVSGALLAARSVAMQPEVVPETPLAPGSPSGLNEALPEDPSRQSAAFSLLKRALLVIGVLAALVIVLLIVQQARRNARRRRARRRRQQRLRQQRLRQRY